MIFTERMELRMGKKLPIIGLVIAAVAAVIGLIFKHNKK